MGWSTKYKKSIDCNNPKGFSQKAHCAGRKKRSEGMENQIREVIRKLVNERSINAIAKAQQKNAADIEKALDFYKKNNTPIRKPLLLKFLKNSVMKKRNYLLKWMQQFHQN